MAGIIVVIVGVLRLGRTISYLPWPVIEELTVGIGAMASLRELFAALGTENIARSTNAVLAAIISAQWPATLLPLVATNSVIILMLLLTRVSGRLPASFLAIVVVTVATQAFSLLLATIDTLPTSLPAPPCPGRHRQPHPTTGCSPRHNRIPTLRPSRLSNDGCGRLQRRPRTGWSRAGIHRVRIFWRNSRYRRDRQAAVNVCSRSRTRVSALVHSLALLIVVYFAAQILAVMPLAALSGVLMATAARIISPTVMKQVLRAGKSEAVVFTIIAAITVSFDLIFAVSIGIAAVPFFALRALSTASVVHREELP